MAAGEGGPRRRRTKDKLKGTSLNDVISGGDNVDKLWGGLGNDTMNGGNGNDALYGEGGNDTLNGDAGSDTAYGGAGADTLSGGTGNDRLYGDADNDTVNGGDGNDALQGGTGDDTMSGGNGNDTVIGGAGADTITGDAGNDLLMGGMGVDSLTGGEGNDTIVGGHGADDIIGGNGSDTVSYGTADQESGVIIHLDTGHGYEGDAEGDDYTSIENALGSVYNDAIYGSTGANVINGNFGDDYIEDGAGNDTVNGGDGSDWIVATEGDTDTYDGGAGLGDILDVSGWTAGATINMTTNRMGADTIRGFEIVKATDLADTITGSSLNETIYTGDGANTVRTMGGFDKVFLGTDVDTVVYASTDVWDATFSWLGHDRIYNFDAAEDILDISAMLDGLTPGFDIADVLTATVVGSDTVLSARYTGANTDQVQFAVLMGVTTSVAALDAAGALVY
ncbi:MAG: calcium-binding protein [Hyphomicrobiaceae bacterium]